MVWELFKDAAKDVIEAIIKGVTGAVLERGGKRAERRIAFAKDRVAPIERFVAETRRHLDRLRGSLAMWGVGAAYDEETQTRTTRLWRTMSHELARLENDAFAAAALVDPKLLRLLEDTRHRAMLLYRALMFAPAARQGKEPVPMPDAFQKLMPAGHVAMMHFPPARPGAPVRLILKQLEQVCRANDRVAERLRRLLTVERRETSSSRLAACWMPGAAGEPNPLPPLPAGARRRSETARP